MLQKVHINGFEYFADVNAQILYTDRDKKSGSPFTFLTANEQKQLQNELRFPRKEKVQKSDEYYDWKNDLYGLKKD